MRKILYGIVVLSMLFCCSVTSAPAQVSIGIGLPNLSIGINLPSYPELVPVPGYPVYYAPGLDYNYFFYDGMYWVYQDDNWYASNWYNGPWALVGPEVVPAFILRVPVSYYRHPPAYFRGWRADAPPRWGQHWGREWQQHRKGWNKWDRGSVPARAPLPDYQRHYTGDRYPRQMEQQRALHGEQYRYQPRDKAIRQHYQQHGEQRGPGQQEMQHQAPPQEHRGPAFREQPGTVQHEHQAPMPQGHEQRMEERSRQQEPGRDHGEGQKREDDRGR